MSLRPPLWGNFVYYADFDLLSFGLLMKGGMFVPAMYHGVQAVEKYFKALALSIVDAQGPTETTTKQKWLKSHDLLNFALRCREQHPYYIQPDITNHLRRFSEYDQAARYPWVNQQYGNGFSGTDIPILEDIVSHLRNDLPIIRDDYPLGMLVRGHHHQKPETKRQDLYDNLQQFSVVCLKEIFRDVDGLVRWQTTQAP